MKKLLPFLLIISLLLSVDGTSQQCSSILNQLQVKDAVSKGQYIWAATSGGLVKIDTLTKSKVYFTKENSGLPQNGLRQIEIDADGNLWMITDHSLIIKYDENSYETHDLSSQLNVSGFKDLLFFQGKLYTCSGSNLLIYENGTWTKVAVNYTGKRSSVSVEKLEAGVNELHLSGRGFDYTNGFEVFSHFLKFNGSSFSLLKEFQNSNPVLDDDVDLEFTVDNNDNIWARQFEGGLVKIEVGTGLVTRFGVPSNVRNCPDIHLNVIIYENGKIYCGGPGKNGLIIFDIATSGWSSINDSNSSMPESDVKVILYYSDTKVYMEFWKLLLG